MQVRAAVLHKAQTPLVVEELDLAPPGAGEVLVQICAAGVCHSDYHVISGQADHVFPVVLGHEGAGRVMAVGDGVSELGVGDHVVLSWLPYCGTCFFCQRDKTQLCRTHQGPLWDGTMLDGTCRLSRNGEPVRHLSMLACWADHAVVPEESCVKMSKDVPFEIAALLGCAVTTGVGAALNCAAVEPGSTVAVMGAGGVGLSIIMGARLAGARQIIVIDAVRSAEPMARLLGATEFLETTSDTREDVLGMTEGRGADYTFEAVGKPALQQSCLAMTRPGGTLVLVGMAAADDTMAVPSTRLIRDEVTIKGSIFGSAQTDRDFVAFADHYLHGRLPIDRLIGQHYRLDEVNQACANMLSGAAGRGVIMFDHADTRQ